MLRNAELGGLSNADDRRTFLMQNAMLTAEEELDPDDLKEKAFDKKWRTKLDPLKKAQQLKEEQGIRKRPLERMHELSGQYDAAG